jgi:dTDP-4-amino-4,6-dideoxy-D-galactose acyltransferase
MLVSTPTDHDTEPPAVILGWDSGFWGMRIGRTTPAAVSGEQDQLSQWARDHEIDCLYLRCPADDAHAVEAARRFGFRRIESRVEYECTIQRAHSFADDRIRPVLPSDIAAVTNIARTAHRDSRFYADPHFADHRCDDLFATWIVNSCVQELAEWVLVAAVDGHVRGYVAGVRDSDGAGRIGLIAVAENARGHGIGRSLVAAAAVNFARDGVTVLRVATQARNQSANRLYRRAGFAQMQVSHDLHWWSEGNPTRWRQVRND